MHLVEMSLGYMKAKTPFLSLHFTTSVVDCGEEEGV